MLDILLGIIEPRCVQLILSFIAFCSQKMHQFPGNMLQPRYISGPVFNVECFPIYLVDLNLKNGSSLVPGWNVNLAQDKEKRHKCLLMRDGLSL